jgi:3-hydroxy-9,10-secoandrosta-1,3,5(10)-triene-9,17-dione monooxygenase reductase component
VRTTVDPNRFRQVLGHFCTGVTVVTSVDGTQPVGFSCQAFAALSLDPPLVLFCPGRGSRTWPCIERAGRFCVNVLTEAQQKLCQQFGSRGVDKFDGTGWTPSSNGTPVLDDVLTWIDCTVEAVHEAGDHYVVIGRVTELGPHREDRPLLFYRGGYTATDPDAVPGSGMLSAGALETLLTWSRNSDWV